MDLFPDPTWSQGFDQLPQNARDAWRVLREHTKSRSGMGVIVDLSDRVLFEAFQHYGVESIHCVADESGEAAHLTGDRSGAGSVSMVFRRDPEFPLVYNHDQGLSVSFELTDEESASVRKRLQTSGIPEATLDRPLS